MTLEKLTFAEPVKYRQNERLISDIGNLIAEIQGFRGQLSPIEEETLDLGDSLADAKASLSDALGDIRDYLDNKE